MCEFTTGTKVAVIIVIIVYSFIMIGAGIILKTKELEGKDDSKVDDFIAISLLLVCVTTWWLLS